MTKLLISLALLLTCTDAQAGDWALVTMGKSLDQTYVDDSGITVAGDIRRAQWKIVYPKQTQKGGPPGSPYADKWLDNVLYQGVFDCKQATRKLEDVKVTFDDGTGLTMPPEDLARRGPESVLPRTVEGGAMQFVCAWTPNRRPVASAQSTKDILGEWQIAPESTKGLPPACRTNHIKITSKIIVEYSGDSVMVGSYQPLAYDSGLVLSETIRAHNGKPNCQGVPADVVIEHFQGDLEIEVLNGRLRVYFPSRSSGTYLEFVRRENQRKNGNA